jgi:hypothetical protein
MSGGYESLSAESISQSQRAHEIRTVTESRSAQCAQQDELASVDIWKCSPHRVASADIWKCSPHRVAPPARACLLSPQTRPLRKIRGFFTTRCGGPRTAAQSLSMYEPAVTLGDKRGKHARAEGRRAIVALHHFRQRPHRHRRGAWCGAVRVKHHPCESTR